jgi:hypothetical protein
MRSFFDVMASRPARGLEIEYFYGIAAEDFRRATVEMLARNVAPESLAAMQPQIEALNTLYRDEFSDVVHRMWWGRDPVDESLRDVLLRVS